MKTYRIVSRGNVSVRRGYRTIMDQRPPYREHTITAGHVRYVPVRLECGHLTELTYAQRDNQRAVCPFEHGKSRTRAPRAAWCGRPR